MSEDYGELVKRLRTRKAIMDITLPEQAADAIEALVRENEELGRALSGNTDDKTGVRNGSGSGTWSVFAEQKTELQTRIAALEQELDEQLAISARVMDERCQQVTRAEQAESRADQLEAEVMSLSHPVCQQLLTDKRLAQAAVERLTGERDAMLETHLAALAQIECCDKAQAALRAAGDVIHSEFCQSTKCLPPCLAVQAALGATPTAGEG